MKPKFLDLFAGAGGLSEGFIQAGYEPVTHVEMDAAACFTLKTRLCYHWLKEQNLLSFYNDYISGKLSREGLYSKIPNQIVNSVLNCEISSESIPNIFEVIDEKLNGQELDLIVGGPPCQAYSLVGRSRDINGMKGDKRNYLFKFYAEFLKRYQPKYFVFENVLGLLSAKDSNGELYFDQMKTVFMENGYTTEYKVLDSSDFGIPQSRKRIVLIGKLYGEEGFYPKLTKYKEMVNVRDVLHDLPSIQNGKGTHRPQKVKPLTIDSYLHKTGIRLASNEHVTWHQARPHNSRDLDIYEMAISMWNTNKERLKYDALPKLLRTHNNTESFLDRYKVVVDSKPSHTVVAHIAKDGHYYIHPDIKQKRSLTVREAARIQTFPDSFYFEGVTEKPSRTAAFKQIGNAVPVILAHQIAQALKEKFKASPR